MNNYFFKECGQKKGGSQCDMKYRVGRFLARLADLDSQSQGRSCHSKVYTYEIILNQFFFRSSLKEELITPGILGPKYNSYHHSYHTNMYTL